MEKIYREGALDSIPLLGKVWCPSQSSGQSGQAAFEVTSYAVTSQFVQRLQTTMPASMPGIEITPQRLVLM